MQIGSRDTDSNYKVLIRIQEPGPQAPPGAAAQARPTSGQPSPPPGPETTACN
ncbi:Hypothetical predicted protein [Xyrichtys novacula]|uniref:Uncharacterized protein n=1 Tax=Xyrichtys novacula TaxID=13765 RepID=A0AAV1GXP6_XYRNO|nr:Hypothetical predicted protein [Xyrichtys novacula]